MRKLAAAIVASLALASPASAAVMIATFKGTAIVPIYDEGDLHIGIEVLPWKARAVYDTTLGFGTEAHREGGWVYDYTSVCPATCTSPITSGQFFLAREVHHFDGYTFSAVATSQGISFGLATEFPNSINMHLPTPAAPARLDIPFEGWGLGYGAWDVDTLLEVHFVSVSPAPEPAVWVSMIVGFFALGGAIRLRRGQLARA